MANGNLTPDRLAELRRIAAETTPGTYEWRIIETALALLDRIEALEAFVIAEKAVRDHAVTCVYWDWKPGACPGGVCMELLRAREAAYQRALAAINTEEGGATDGR